MVNDNIKNKIQDVQKNIKSGEYPSDSQFDELYNDIEKCGESDDLESVIQKHLAAWEQNHPEAVNVINAISDFLSQLGI